MRDRSVSGEKVSAEDRPAREAAVWFATLLDEATPASHYAEFRDWLDADRRNAEAYARLERLWNQAGSEPAPLPAAAPSRRAVLKGAAAVVLFAGAGGAGWTYLHGADYSTGVGELRTLSLPDGSHVELSAASAIRVEFDASIRRVILLGGEAFFQVKADPARPFVVTAQGLTATALGTAFSVSILPERTSVAVEQHAVRVAARGVSLDVGEGGVVDFEAGRLGRVIADEAETRLSWRSRQLAFFARPLGEIVAVLNRWREGRLVILDSALAARRVTTIIDMSDLERIDRTLEQGLPVTLSSYTPFLTLVSAKK